MHLRRNRWSSVCGLAIAMVVAFVVTDQAVAQNNNNNAAGVAGVAIDAEGVLRTQFVRDPGGSIAQQRIREARSNLDRDLLRVSNMRKISLNRLEQAISESLAAGQEPTDEMLNLAGMTSIEYVFFYPETNDIVIAGPAEGFYQNAAGRNVGIRSGKATLLLEDLVVALRAFGPNGSNPGQVGCSIDPTQEGLERMQQFLASIPRNGRPNPNQIASGLVESLGLHTVSVQGYPENTHAAQVLVEADYRMKLIGIGLEQPNARIPSYVSEASPRNVAANAMQRWYFTPNYECLLVSEDDLGMQLIGDRVKLIGEDELVGADGARSASGNVNRASQVFCHAFTEHFDTLANNTPIYAQLRNIVDMTIVAAYIQHQDYYGMSGWDLGVLGDESQFPVETHAAPKQVESAVNVVWKGRSLMTPIGGGVEIHAQKALELENVSYDEEGSVADAREQQSLDLEAGQWWWD